MIATEIALVAQLSDGQRHQLSTDALAATELARAGLVSHGYRLLKQKMEAAQAAGRTGDPWGTVLAWCYWQVLNRFTWEYGGRLVGAEPTEQ